MKTVMKQSGVTFDFESFKKSTVGAGTIILTPTIHISKRGEFSIYCINDDSKYSQVRFAKSGDIVGIELLETKEHNSYSVKNMPSSLRGRISSISNFLDLEHFIGTEFHSGNFPLYQQSENVWWFDLKEAHSKNKPIKKSLVQSKVSRVKALRGV
ncbi:hypothetical protein V6B05_01410 [Lactococcus garvieae]|uniref:hypothetical protein n=1 Tax=Lactococcus garvieae TaxID=1363 RepID=UPI001F6053C6|nr:hypothetical protein [Lactococcus garvieae]MCI3860084.1 hypothetical protein [Lactococcus garvieae]